MYLDKDQQKWIIKIYEGKIKSFKDFILNHSGLIIDDENASNLIVESDREDEILGRILKFIVLLKKLRSSDLIFQEKIKYSNDIRIPSVFRENKDSMENLSFPLNGVIKQRYYYIYTPFPELDDFIKNEFQTSEEIQINEEKKDRKNAQIITIVVALASILASILIGLFQLNQDRSNGFIQKNSEPSSDTLKVKQLEKAIPDSVQEK